MTSFDLAAAARGKHVFVAGGSSGINLGIGEVFAARGFATAGFANHDTLAVDACDNLYVTEFPSVLYRIGPDGAVEALVTFEGLVDFAHGLEFGSGVGGWRTDALYSARPFSPAGVGELVQHFKQLGDVVEMQARGRLVEDVERATGGALRQLFRQLDALGFAA